MVDLVDIVGENPLETRILRERAKVVEKLEKLDAKAAPLRKQVEGYDAMLLIVAESKQAKAAEAAANEAEKPEEEKPEEESAADDRAPYPAENIKQVGPNAVEVTPASGGGTAEAPAADAMPSWMKQVPKV